jgi:hypothetical protein
MTQQGQFLMSPPDQFLMSFDSRERYAINFAFAKPGERRRPV